MYVSTMYLKFDHKRALPFVNVVWSSHPVKHAVTTISNTTGLKVEYYLSIVIIVIKTAPERTDKSAYE